MNNPLAFEQDDEAPPGTGTFRFEDGSSLYAMEPELAARLSPGPKLAQVSGDPAQSALHQRLLSAGPPPGTGDTYGAMSDAPAAGGVSMPPEAFDESSLPAHMRTAPKPAPPPAPMGPPLPPGGVAPPPPAPRPAPPRPMVHYAGRNPAAEAAAAVPVPTKASTVVERSGAPYNPEMAGMREDANRAVVSAKLAEFEAQKLGHEQQATAMAASLPALRQKEAEQRTAFEKLRGAAQKERERINQYIDAFDKNAKVNPNRIYEAGFGLGGAAMIIGQALGAYAATLAGGDNFAQRAVQQRLEADLAAQRDDIQEGRRGIDNMLSQLEQEYGNAEQAESAWRLMHAELLDREIKSYQAAANAPIVDRAAAVWLAQNQQARLMEEQKFMDLSMGKQTQTMSADMVVPRRPGSRPMTDAELEERQIKDNERGVRLHKSENELGYERGGGKHGAESKPDAALYVEGFGQAKTPKEAIALRAAIAERNAAHAELDRTQTLDKSTWAKLGFRVPFTDVEIGSDEYTEAGQLAERSKTTTARSYGGPITQSDRDAAGMVTPDARKLTGNQDVRVESARKAIDELTQQKIDQIISGNHGKLPEAREEKDD